MTARSSAVATLTSSRTSLHLLGGFELHVDGRPQHLTAASQRLVALLALRATSHRGASRSVVAATLWPDISDARAGANLRGVIWRLPPAVGMKIERDVLSIRLGTSWSVDATEVASAARCIVDDQPVRGFDARLLELDLLPGWYDEWLVTAQERYRQLRLNALERLARADLESGALAAAADLGLVLTCEEPLRESAQRVLIEAYMRQGNHALARRQFDQFAAQLRQELGIGPSPSLGRLVHDVGPSSLEIVDPSPASCVTLP